MSPQPSEPSGLLELVTASLADDKAIDTVVVDLHGKTSIAEHMVVATGTSQRHIASMADKLVQRLKEVGQGGVQAEGKGDTGWVLIDAGDVIVHLFRAETRVFYDLEKLWGMTPPSRAARRVGGAG